MGSFLAVNDITYIVSKLKSLASIYAHLYNAYGSPVIFITLWDNSARDKLMVFFLIFLRKKGFEMSSKLSPLERLWMKCQNLISRKSKKKYFNMSSAEVFPRVLNVNSQYIPRKSGTIKIHIVTFTPQLSINHRS